ncbi:hypothetical protein GO993_10465 [Aeromonas salmonicida subsp. salmonicida]|uniref:hypothetical protein n=1 Tax=Aeromonas salmonicida TaxID=645 RepID=UPI00131FF15E|nr:hypothetical protein [Aeromonas salmonicida]QHE48372.1 hypothetical protein GO994_14930 [Aeromonas salmonicida subsp. salmonicida]QJF55938.1 hypothetical protein GO993_10465 [Aeromonas salmonicida subsp. salmonicida]
MKRFTHDADLRGMVVLRSLGFQLVPFKLHRFRKQRRTRSTNVPSWWDKTGWSCCCFVSMDVKDLASTYLKCVKCCNALP